MEDNNTVVSSTRAEDYGYGLAYQLAREQLSRITDIERHCLRSGAEYLPEKRAVAVDYINRRYLLGLESAEVSLVAEAGEVPIRDKLLILHYFLQAKGTQTSGRMITYKELKEGASYFPTFAKRAIAPVLNQFGREPARLLDAARFIGGFRADYGDMAVTVPAFSRISLTWVLWAEDAEFPADGSVLFDGNISDYLTNDDIHTLCEIIAWKLVRLDRTGGGNSGKR